MSKAFFVYIMASDRNGTIYIGVTNDPARRALEHREGLVPGFTKKYGVKRLVYYETPVSATPFTARRGSRSSRVSGSWS